MPFIGRGSFRSGLERDAGAQKAAVPRDHADPAHYVFNMLVAADKGLRSDGLSRSLQADPACHCDRRRQDQFQPAKILVGLPVMAVQEGPAL